MANLVASIWPTVFELCQVIILKQLDPELDKDCFDPSVARHCYIPDKSHLSSSTKIVALPSEYLNMLGTSWDWIENKSNDSFWLKSRFSSKVY
jgi:hypothetical protein